MLVSVVCVCVCFCVFVRVWRAACLFLLYMGVCVFVCLYVCGGQCVSVCMRQGYIRGFELGVDALRGENHDSKISLSWYCSLILLESIPLFGLFLFVISL